MPKLATHTLQYAPKELRIHIDEAWRWPLAWPVWVGATMSLSNKFDRSQFKDSKQLSESQREGLYKNIQSLEKSSDLIYAWWRATNVQIDHHGIIHALHDATCMAIFGVLKKFFISQRRAELSNSTYGIDQLAIISLTKAFRKRKANAPLIRDILATPNTIVKVNAILLDGNNTFGLDRDLGCAITTIIKGDQKNPLISAASIVAKVERDRYMVQVAKKFPAYAFAMHKWYGTEAHIKSIRRKWLTPIHRVTFCKDLMKHKKIPHFKTSLSPALSTWWTLPALITEKPKLLLHICCAPDLTRPLHWLKDHFKLYLFRYNPNIHPRAEHTHRYDQFIKLIWLEKGDYEILEDRYDPKEFFKAMYDQRDTIAPDLKDAPQRTVLQVAGKMEERSDRCNPCYSMRLDQAANMAAKEGIPYFTSTLLISPKKKMDKLFDRWVEAEHNHPWTKFLRFDFAKNQWYDKASQLTKQHWLYRQNYCGCGWTIKNKKEWYVWG